MPRGKNARAFAAAAAFAVLSFVVANEAAAQTLNLATTIPAASFVGEPFCYTDTLTNAGPTGYGPYIRLVVPAGITFTSASFLGIGATILDVGVFPVAGTLTDPWAAQTVAGTAGEHLYLIAPPIGSLVTGQPPVVLDICMAIATSAVVGTPLNVKTTPAYRYGNTPTGVNGPLVFATRTDPVTPTLVKFSKANGAPESERPPGPSFPVTFTLTSDIANTKTLTNLVFTDTLPANLQFTAGSILVNGGACGAGCTINQQPSGATPGGTVRVTVASATGTTSASDVTVSYAAFVPAGILNPAACQTQAVQNAATLAATYLGVAQPVLNATSSLTAKHVALQKGASASPAVPGGTVTYTLNFQVSDFVTASGLVLTDTLPDGVTFGSVSSATVGGSPVTIVPGVVHNGVTGVTVVTLNVGAVTGALVGPKTGQITYTATIDTTYEGAPLALQPVRQNDNLANTVRADYTLAGGAACSDTSGASITIAPISIAKSIVNPKPEYVPGDVVTFRLRMNIPSGDVQSVSFEDFLPLPVFVATTIPTTFPSTPGVRFGPGNTLPGTVPTVTTIGATNSIRFVFPDITTASAQVLEVEFDITVTNTPFADQLSLTNLFQAKANNSVLTLTTNLTPVSIQVRAPKLVFTKGVLSTDNAAAVISPLPSILPVNGNVTGVDARDVVTFRMTVENTGGAQAVNVTITDPTPAGFTGCALGTVTDGTGAALATTGSLAAGLVLTNPLAANDNTPPGGGAPYGTDTALVTVACTVAGTVAPLQVLTNTGSATWTSLGGSTTFPAVSDSATATVAPPVLAKTGGGVSLPIGGTTSYTVTATVPEGVTSSLTLVDTLPAGLAFVSQTGAVVSGGVTVGGSTTPVVTNNGQTVTWNLGTVTNSNSSNSTPETIALTYTVVVLNVAGNTGGVTLRNSVAGSYTGGSLGAVQAPAVTVLEPALSATKGVVVGGSGTQGDAGDSVTYTITLSHAGTSTAPAFDVTVNDPLPKSAAGPSPSLIVGPAFTAVDNPGGTNVSAAFALTGADATGWTLATTGAPALNLALGHTITITITGSLADKSLLTPNQSIVNTADVRWTSVAGNPGTISTYNTNSTERDGSGTGSNNYRTTPSATITVFPPAPAKSIVATSEAGTADPTVAIGEIVRYRLAIRMAEATATNLQLVDALPAGLQYLNDGTTRVAFVCNGVAVPCMASTGPNAISGAGLVASGASSAVSPTFVLPGANISGGPFGSGTAPTFTLGNVVNNDTDADSEFVVLEFNALVLNVGGNASGTNLDNTFTVSVNGAPVGAASPAARVTVGQPSLTAVKSGSRATGAGGDTVTYTVTLTNGSGANVTPVYDATVTDTLPALLQLSLASVNVTLAGGASGVTNGSALQTVSIVVSTIPPGGSATITYTAAIQPGGSPGQALVNTAATGWSSLPGPNGTTPNGTGSTTPGASGSGTGERQYTASPTWTVTIASPSLTKSVFSTSEGSTSGNSVAIGEKVQYRVAVRIPEGTTSTSVVLSDALPAGLAIVSLDALEQVDSAGTTISSLTLAPNTLAQVLSNAQAALASPGQALAFNLGTVTNTDLNTATGEFVRATYTAVVLNVAGNARGATLTNTASFARNGASTITASAPTLTVAEPRLTVVKAASPAAAYAGDVVTFTLTVSNPTVTNGTDAFDAALSDTVPAGLTLVAGTLQNVSGPAATLSEAGPLTATWATFAQGATAVLRFQARVNANVTAGQSITNTATATWTSLPGSPGQISTLNADSTERTGSGTPAQNNYTASGPATVTANPRADLRVVKTAAPTAVAAGGSITYTLVASNLGPSDAANASLSDPLSSGTTFVSLAAAAGWACATPAVGATGTVSCTRALLAAGAADTFTLVVQVPAVTLAGTLLGNTAAITSTTADPNPSNNVSTVTTPVAAATDADLAVTKTGTPAAVVTGANVTYAVTVTNNGPGAAANAVLTDLVPAGAAFVSATPPAGWSCTTPNVTCTNPSVAAGASGVFTIVLQATGAAGSTITNTATVSSATNDAVPANNTSSASTGVVGAAADADVAVTKTGPAGPVAPGRVVTYTLTVVNNGPATATGVSVADPAPAGLSFVANSGACTTAFPCALGTLAPGASATITTQFLVSSPFTGSSPYTNTATVSTASADPVVSNNTSSVSTTVATAPTDADLTIAKSDSPDPVYAGSNVRYTIVVTNNGPGTASGASVTDVLPGGTSFVSATPSQGSCSGTTTVTCALGSIAPGETATVTLFVRTSVGGTISNTATVTSTSNDPVPGNNSSTTPTSVIAPDVTIAKVHAPASFARGSTGAYTLTVSSLPGATAAPTTGTVTVTDTVPAGLTPTGASGVPDWACGVVLQVVTCTTSNVLLPGASYAAITVGVNVLEGAPASLSNTATVSGGGDVTPGNNSSTDVAPVISTGDLSVTKNDGVASVIPGTTTTYTIVVANSGPSAVTNAPVTDTLPAAIASATWTCVPSAGSSCGAANGTGSIASTVSLLAGGSATYTLVAAISPAATGTVANTATVAPPGGFTDTNPGNNSSTDTDTLTPQADVSVVKTGPPTLVPGQNAAYTLTVANAGPSTAVTVALLDTLPAGTTFVSLASPGGWACTTPAVGAGGTVSCSIASLAPLASGVFTLTVRVTPAVLTGTAIPNTATVTTATTDTNPGNNSSTSTGTASPSADLAIAKTGPATAVPGGANVVFTTVVTNNGPSDAQAVSVADPTPANLTFVSNAGACAVAFPCSLGTVPAGATRTITSTYAIPAGYPAGAPIVNTATVSSATSDPLPGNNSSTANVLVPTGVADVAVAKTVSNPAPAVGTNVTFTVTVSDLGPSDASGIAVTDVLPSGLTFVSATPSQGAFTAATGVWTVGSVANGASATLAIVATVTQAGTIVNTATKTLGDQTDPNSSNNSGSAVVNGPAQVADVQVQKAVDNATPIAGNNVTFTVTARNAGPSNATGVAVTDTLPPGLTFVSATPSVGTYVPGSGVWTIGNLANGASVTLALVATVTANGTYVNTARKTAGNEFDPNTSNDAGVAGVVAGGGGSPRADLGILKADSPDPVRAGQNLTYTLVVTNRGPNDATGVTVADPLPAGVSFVSASASQGGCSGTTAVTCLLGGLAAGNSATVTVVVSVSAAAVPSITNTATVSANETDPNPSDNAATAPTTVLPAADVGLLKTVSNPAPLVTQSFTFTVTATNNGPSTATNVQVTDALPANLGFVSAAPSQGAYVSGTGVWTVGTLASGASATLTLTVTALAPGAFTNTATKTGQTEFDPNPTNDSASSTGGVGVVADLTIAKGHSPATFVRGTTATFTLTVSNGGTGPTNAPVTVADALPAGFTPTAASGAGWGCSVAAPNVTCTRSDVLGSGAAWPPISITVNVLQTAAASVTNAASVSGGGDVTPGNNGGTDVVPVVSSADLSVVKTGPANAIPGSNVVYTLVVTNNGPSDAASVSVADATPANLTFVSNAGACATPFPCALGTVPAGATRTITTTFAIPSNYTAPSPIVNTAAVSSATPDPNPANDSSTASTSVAADLGVVKSVEPPAPGSESITFVLVVTNNGPSTATGVVLTDPLPPSVVFQTVTSTQGVCSGTPTVTCGLGTIPNGGTATVRVTVRPVTSYVNVVNTANVTGDQFDPDTTNNVSSATYGGPADVPSLSVLGLMILGAALALAGARALGRS